MNAKTETVGSETVITACFSARLKDAQWPEEGECPQFDNMGRIGCSGCPQVLRMPLRDAPWEIRHLRDHDVIKLWKVIDYPHEEVRFVTTVGQKEEDDMHFPECDVLQLGSIRRDEVKALIRALGEEIFTLSGAPAITQPSTCCSLCAIKDDCGWPDRCSVDFPCSPKECRQCNECTHFVPKED
jgi:hypothetical protein